MSLAKAMGDAAHGAVLGRAIGEANDQAEIAIEKAHGWMRYASSMEAEVARLNQRIKAMEQAHSAELEEAQAKARKAQESADGFYNAAVNQAERRNANEDRAKQYKSRLSQVEKALRHSSANIEALKFLLEPYKAIVDRMRLQGELPEDLAQKADEIWQKYMDGEDLTNDPDVQAILDANPLPPKPRFSDVD